VQSKFWSLIG
jgi:hypothetical protein